MTNEAMVGVRLILVMVSLFGSAGLGYVIEASAPQAAIGPLCWLAGAIGTAIASRLLAGVSIIK